MVKVTTKGETSGTTSLVTTGLDWENIDSASGKVEKIITNEVSKLESKEFVREIGDDLKISVDLNLDLPEIEHLNIPRIKDVVNELKNKLNSYIPLDLKDLTISDIEKSKYLLRDKLINQALSEIGIDEKTWKEIKGVEKKIEGLDEVSIQKEVLNYLLGDKRAEDILRAANLANEIRNVENYHIKLRVSRIKGVEIEDIQVGEVERIYTHTFANLRNYTHEVIDNQTSYFLDRNLDYSEEISNIDKVLGSNYAELVKDVGIDSAIYSYMVIDAALANTDYKLKDVLNLIEERQIALNILSDEIHKVIKKSYIRPLIAICEYMGSSFLNIRKPSLIKDLLKDFKIDYRIPFKNNYNLLIRALNTIDPNWSYRLSSDRVDLSPYIGMSEDAFKILITIEDIRVPITLARQFTEQT